MEPITLPNPTIIQVVGLPGAGKSFFASQFAETLGAPIVSRDKIRWLLFSHHGYTHDEEFIVSQVADMLIAELIKTHKTFILDGGYNSRAARDRLDALAKKHSYRVITVIVQADELAAKTRSIKRSGNKSVDKYKQPLTVQMFEKQVKAYQPPTINSNNVVISGKHTYNTQARAVLKKIVENQQSAIPARPTTRTVRGPFIQ